MNLVTTHSNCTSPMDYISHHALHSHIPSTITPITQLSPFTHSHKSTHKHSLSAKSCFAPADILSVILPAISVFDPGLPDLGTLNLCLWPRPLPGIVYVSALLWYSCFCLLTIARLFLLPLLIKHLAASESTRLRPVITESLHVSVDLQSHPTSPSTCQSHPTSPSTCQSHPPSTCQSHPTLRRPARSPHSPSTCQSHPTSPPTCQSHPTSPPTCQSHPTSPPTCQSHPTSPPTCQSHLMSPPADLPESPHSVSADLPVTSRLRRPARVTSRLRRPARVTSRLRRPARVTSRHSSLPSVTSRLCCLSSARPGGLLSHWPHMDWPSIPSPGFHLRSTTPWSMLCVSVWKPLFGGGSVMNLVTTHSNCTSPRDYISHHALHSHIPVHHYPITQLSPFTHSHKSSTQTLTLCEVLFCPGWHSERYSSCHLCVWPRTARPWNSEPVPVTSTPAWYCLYVSALPLIFLFLPADHCPFVSLPLLIKHLAASESTRLRPVITICRGFVLS